MQPNSWQELLAGHRTGDQEASEQLCKLYFPRIIRVVRCSLYNVADVSDESVALSVLESFLLNPEHVQSKVPEDCEDGIWHLLYEIAKRHIRKHAKRRQRRGQHLSLDSLHFDPQDHRVSDEAIADAVESTMHNLREDDALVFRELLAGKTPEQIAKILNKSGRTVWRRMERILRKLLDEK